ncbi:MAG TPA: PEP-CTERM sorting domain-containing protein [Verrucomicrobiae bacterium]|nr:PEP-CTERM sorting domain-containing protein [Verrucomicrobiae bacterium]
MKRLNLTVLAIGAIAFLVSSAQASLLFSEGFNYNTPGTLVPNTNPGGGAWTGGNAGLTIGNGNLTYSGLTDQGGNELSISNGAAGSAINTFANVTSGQIYYSFLLDVTAADSGNNYFTAMNPTTGAPNGGTDAIDAYLYSNGKIGLRTAGAATVTSSSALTLNTTYFVVLEYNFTAQTAYLYLNPTAGGSQPAATLTLASVTTVTAIDDVGFKAASASGNYLVDNLLIGTSWADVTPSTVPEPSVLALAGLGVLGWVARLRRR